MKMTPEIERTIIHYYPKRALTSPLENEGISWDYDTDYTVLKGVLARLEELDPEMRPGTRGRYDISEEVVLFEQFRLQLCYLGPFAALDYGLDRDLDEDGREHKRDIERVLSDAGLELIPSTDLDEHVPWIQYGTPRGATVWNCLFAHPEA